MLAVFTYANELGFEQGLNSPGLVFKILKSKSNEGTKR